MNHSPLPWKYSAEQGTTLLVDSDGTIVGTILFQLDAKFICLAVNHFEELVRALSRMVSAINLRDSAAVSNDPANLIKAAEVLSDRTVQAQTLLAKLEAEK